VGQTAKTVLSIPVSFMLVNRIFTWCHSKKLCTACATKAYVDIWQLCVESINDDILAVDAVTLLIQHQTCNSQVTGSSPGRMRLH